MDYCTPNPRRISADEARQMDILDLIYGWQDQNGVAPKDLESMLVFIERFEEFAKLGKSHIHKMTASFAEGLRNRLKPSALNSWLTEMRNGI